MFDPRRRTHRAEFLAPPDWSPATAPVWVEVARPDVHGAVRVAHQVYPDVTPAAGWRLSLSDGRLLAVGSVVEPGLLVCAPVEEGHVDG